MNRYLTIKLPDNTTESLCGSCPMRTSLDIGVRRAVGEGDEVAEGDSVTTPPPERPSVVIDPKCRTCRKRPRMKGHRECLTCAVMRMTLGGFDA